MGMRSAIVKQFGEPRGFAGVIVGWVLGHRSSNVRRNRWVVTQLDLRLSDRVLEVGFGPGIAIEAFAEALPHGHVYGIDHSEVMVRQATRRNRKAVRSGIVELTRTSVDELPALGQPLDAILAVNSMWFWPEPAKRLNELRSLLRSGGRIAITSQPRWKGATADTSRAQAADTQSALDAAGFTNMRVETLDLEPPVVCVIGLNP
jgi:ubiquinone/menaquinone biosynthesis C-methylase UbiE